MAEDLCIICGEEHPRCTAHAKIRDENGQPTGAVRPCMRQPRKGVAVCNTHGGQLPTVRAAAERRAAREAMEADSRAYLVSTGDEGVGDIGEAMERLTAMALSMVDGYAKRVNALGAVRYGSEYSVEQIRGEVVMLDKAITQASKLLEMTARHKPDGEVAAAVNLLSSLNDAIKGQAE